jgi:predicted dehydrogenase
VTLKIGVVGSGAWARRAHIPALHRSCSAELAGVWGRNTDAAGRLADAAGCRNYATLKELIEDVDIVDIVGTPNAHASAARHVDLIDKIDYVYPQSLTGSWFQQGVMMEL